MEGRLPVFDVYFQDSYHRRRLLTENVTEEDAYKTINDFMDEHNFKCYYIRTCKHEDETILDVGSHTEFFIFKDRRES